MYLCSCCLYSHHHCLLSHPSPAAHHPISLHDALPIFTARRMEYTPSNLLRRITTPGQGYSEFHYGIDRQRVIRRDGNQAGVSRRVHYNGIIHMNGRIYDPHLARFLQADPFVEDPGTLNRYTYVHNNPLVYYDPSGYFSLKSFLKIGAAVAISFLGGQIIAGKIWASLGIKAGSAAAYGVAAAAGALSGYIMTGTSIPHSGRGGSSVGMIRTVFHRRPI